ncbi:MAG: phenylalanine--tRNA ligase subunit beta [Aquabacterium sp.]
MQFPESWLREFCDPPLSTTELADVLTMGGLEVEDVRPAAPPFKGVVVGRIVSCEPHPQADRLQICRVDAGEHTPDGPVQVVCGAPNARAGLRAPFALVGATLPPDREGKALQIGLGRLRGVESHGMLCSSRELQLDDDHGGLLELSDDASLGQSIREHLRLDDQVFTLKLTPNLGHCLSVHGVARELAAMTGAPLKASVWPVVAADHVDRLPVHIKDIDLCGRFSGRVVRDIDPARPTPHWMVQRLARCGQRSVNPLVDISNYVMFEYGRPSHIFDLDRIQGHLEVRWGRPGEQLKLLNGNTVNVDPSVGVIADELAVESLAGIMGGDATAVSDTTRHVYIEAAFWRPEAVQGRSRRYGFSTDAGHRFERGVDPASTVEHIERITSLVLQICGGRAGPIDDQQPAMPVRQPVRLRIDRAARVIGMPLTQDQCARALRRLQLPVEQHPGVLVVQPPSWRFDLTIEEDLIEEVVRQIGYDNLPAVPPRAAITGRIRPESRRGVHALRHGLAAAGYQETINYSFVEDRWERELAGRTDAIRVLNPIAAPLSVMRSSLMGGLLQVLRHNLDRRADRVRVFEIGRAFIRDNLAGEGDQQVAGLRQPLRLAALAYGPARPVQWGTSARMVDFFDMKGDLETLLAPVRLQFEAAVHPAMHPGRCAIVMRAGQPLGVMGELHPKWRHAYELPSSPMLLELDVQPILECGVPVFEPLPRHPAALRDLALVVPDTCGHDTLMKAVMADTEGLLRHAAVFDIYRPVEPTAEIPVGHHSLALRLEWQAPDATLTDVRVDAAMAALVERATAATGAQVRGSSAHWAAS